MGVQGGQSQQLLAWRGLTAISMIRAGNKGYEPNAAGISACIQGRGLTSNGDADRMFYTIREVQKCTDDVCNVPTVCTLWSVFLSKLWTLQICCLAKQGINIKRNNKLAWMLTKWQQSQTCGIILILIQNLFFFFNVWLLLMELIYRIYCLSFSCRFLYSLCCLFQYWTDIYLSWNPDNYPGVQNLRFPSNLVWVPDILLYNRWDILRNLPSAHPATNLVSHSCPQLLILRHSCTSRIPHTSIFIHHLSGGSHDLLRCSCQASHLYGCTRMSME